MFLSIASEPLKRKDVQNLLFKMEDIKEAIVETLEDVNLVKTVETININNSSTTRNFAKGACHEL